ncbi:uncharacterized protein LOC108858684 isoform X1 [Raphanus sativus]|uniref:Uncharacterized protein LOC108858684 isoform X1 n=1 Tax=Raphanus sativus TaxID=3726 RepID=A0A6J0NVB4_RAPSA|nr:uncharacterized protein LOC108858684 isoform X1 [Raphanus sativus]
MGSEKEEDDIEEEELIRTSKLQLVLAAKSRKQEYTSSPVISHHVSLSLWSSPDDLSHSRASVPFSWEEEPGKPKQDTLLRAPPSYPKHLHLPPRLLELTKTPLSSGHPHYLEALKRWFRLKKDRANDHDVVGLCSFAVSWENKNDMNITRTRSRLHCLSDVARCYSWIYTVAEVAFREGGHLTPMNFYDNNFTCIFGLKNW